MELFNGTTAPPDGTERTAAPTVSRRPLLKLLGLSGAAMALPASLAGCATGGGSGPDRTLRIGIVAPRTGTLAAFTESDDYVMAGVKAAVEKGIKAGGATYAIDIAVRDSQSDTTRATEVTEALIDEGNISLILAHSAPDTVIPVAKVCEQRGMPCLSSIVPYEQFASTIKEPKWAYHFYWGQKDSYQIFLHMWGYMPSNKAVGSLWPNDVSGKTWADPKKGFPPAMAKAGYKLLDPGRIVPQTNEFQPIIKQFQARPVDIITGSLQPADFATFWKQAELEGYRPLMVSMSRALQSPAFIEAMSPNPEGLTIAAGWTPQYPYSSSLTGRSSAALAQDYSAATDKQWTQPIAYTHALFEVAIDALKRADDPRDHESVAKALGGTNLATTVGRVNFAKGPSPHVAATPLVGAQWRRSTTWPYELVIVHSMTDGIPEASELRPLR